MYLTTADILYIYYPRTTLKDGRTYELAELRVIDNPLIPNYGVSQEHVLLTLAGGTRNLISYEREAKAISWRGSIGLFSFAGGAFIATMILLFIILKEQKKKEDPLQTSVVL